MDLTKITDRLPTFRMENFCIFDSVNYFEWKKEYDDELWEQRRDVIMKMASQQGHEITIRFLGVNSVHLSGSGQISGFYIADNEVLGYESGNRYEIGDFENGDIKFYCRDIVIEQFKLFAES